MLRKGSKMATFKCLGGKLARDSDNMLRTVEWVVGFQGQNVMQKGSKSKGVILCKMGLGRSGSKAGWGARLVGSKAVWGARS